MTFARPETRYAEIDGVRVGYQTYGTGKRTVIGVPGFAQNIDSIWENPESAAFFERLAFLWPWLLVAAGAFLVVTALRRRGAVSREP